MRVSSMRCPHSYCATEAFSQIAAQHCILALASWRRPVHINIDSLARHRAVTYKSSSLREFRPAFPWLRFSGKEKHMNFKKFAGLSRDWVGAKKLFMCFSSCHSLWGRNKHINKIPPKMPGQSRENYVSVFFSLCVFLVPKDWQNLAT